MIRVSQNLVTIKNVLTYNGFQFSKFQASFEINWTKLNENKLQLKKWMKEENREKKEERKAV